MKGPGINCLGLYFAQNLKCCYYAKKSIEWPKLREFINSIGPQKSFTLEEYYKGVGKNSYAKYLLGELHKLGYWEWDSNKDRRVLKIIPDMPFNDLWLSHQK